MMIFMKKIFFLLLILISLPLFAKGQSENLSAEYFEIANAYSEVKNYEKAIFFYKKSAADKQYKNAAEYNLARVYALQNNWNDASALLERLYRLEPDNQLIVSAYAYSLVGVGKISAAKNIYDRIAQADRENPTKRLDYIKLLIFAKDYQTAQVELETALADFPSAKERPEFEALQKQIDTEQQKNTSESSQQPDQSHAQ